MTKPIAVLKSAVEGDARQTYFWPAGTSLEETGWRLVQAKETTMRTTVSTTADPVRAIEALATRKNLTLEEALLTPEGAEHYRLYKERLVAGQANPPNAAVERPSRFDEMGHFASRKAASELSQLEEDFDDEARQRCRERGWVADGNGIAQAMSELLAENPQRYNAYVKAQRAAGGRGQ